MKITQTVPLTPTIVGTELTEKQMAGISLSQAIQQGLININGDVNFHFQQNNTFNSKEIDDSAQGCLDRNEIDLLTDLFIKIKPRSGDTIIAYRSAIGKFRKFLDTSQTLLKDVRSQSITEYQNSLKKHNPATNKPYKISTKSTYMHVLKTFLSWLTKRTTMVVDLDSMEIESFEKKHRKDCLTDSESADLLNQFNLENPSGLRDYCIVSLMLDNGLRTTEVQTLDFGSYDQKKHGLWVMGKARNETEFVKLHESTAKIFLRYLKSIKPISKYNVKDPLFLAYGNNGGKRITRRSIGRSVSAAMKKVGIKSDRISTHSLRHTFADRMARAGVPLHKIQLHLRHKSSETSQIYLSKIEKEEQDLVAPKDYLIAKETANVN